MAHETELLAPWAELVPGVNRLMTADELHALPDDDGWMYELVEGRLVRMTPSAVRDSARAVRLAGAQDTFVEAAGLGIVSGPDGGYVLSVPGEPQTLLAPDVAFVRAGRSPSPGAPYFDGYWRVVPDLAAEIASPNQSRPALAAKARRYLRAGVHLVWLVCPKYQEVQVWRPGHDQPVATLHAGDMLDGLDVLPGFTFPVDRLL